MGTHTKSKSRNQYKLCVDYTIFMFFFLTNNVCIYHIIKPMCNFNLLNKLLFAEIFCKITNSSDYSQLKSYKSKSIHYLNINCRYYTVFPCENDPGLRKF